jgi:arylsulfatase A-like enzyme
MTGRYHEEHGMKSNQTVLGRFERTWAQHLSEHGYQTVAVGRTHDIHKGFGHVIRVPSGNSYPMDCNAPQLQHHWKKDAYIGPSEAPFDDYYETRITKTALDFLREMKRGGEPFALYIGYLQPHAAFTPPEPYWSMYKNLETALPNDTLPPEDLHDAVHRYAAEVDEEKYRMIVRGYYAMVSCMDACVGMVLDEVERLGLTEDTMVIYTSDHGEMLGNKGLHSKGYGYDPSMRVPLIASCPGTIAQGLVTDALFENVDFANTIMDALGVERMPGASSQSAWEVLIGEKGEHREWIYSTLGNGTVCRNRQYKWIHRNVRKQSIDEVYDMVTDPRENVNLADTPIGKQVIQDFYPLLVNHMIGHFRRPVTDFDPEAVQPRLIPYFTK